MKKSIKLNYSYNLFYQILTLITPLITTPYLSRVLTAEGIGTYSFVESLVSYFVMFSVVGTTAYAQREIAFYQENKEKRTEIFWNVLSLRIVTCTIAVIVYIGTIVILDGVSSIYYIFAINIVATIFDITWLFQGMEEFGLIVLRNTVVKLCNICMIFIFVREINDLVIYAGIMLGMILLGHMSIWPYLNRYVGHLNLGKCNPLYGVKDSLSLFIPTIAIQVYLVLDKTMIGVFSASYTENGYYEQSMKIVKMLLVVVTSLGIVTAPKIANHFANNQVEEIKNRLYKSYRFVWVLGIPITFGIIVTSQNFVSWFFGDGFEKVGILLPILSVLVLAIGVSNVTGMQYFIPTKQQRLFTKSVVIGAVVNLILNLILIPKYYSIGAAIASVIAESIIAVIQLYYVRKEFSMKHIMAMSVKYFIAGFGMLVVLIIENSYFTPSIIHTFLMIMSGSFIYFLILILLQDVFVLNSIKSVISFLKRKRSQ